MSELTKFAHPLPEKPLLLFLNPQTHVLASVYERSNEAFAFEKTRAKRVP